MSPAGSTRLLIVEDESVVATDLKVTLEGLGYEVVGLAESGSKALTQVESDCPDLVLMDIQLQGTMTGIAAASEIRRRWNIPVVYVTANANEQTLERARA